MSLIYHGKRIICFDPLIMISVALITFCCVDSKYKNTEQTNVKCFLSLISSFLLEDMFDTLHVVLGVQSSSISS
jgi:hypothetical protein